ncbi:hypothetical protein [Pengzhenrongella phosphoraccumulans]|uniref:hypothetical protein n=1 Tax=Pengzhenrongella phosphoraccumulans TaxID=3114394 RepID=UPI00388D7F7F
MTASSSQTLAAGVTATIAVSGSGSPWSTGLTLNGSDGTFAIELLAGTSKDLQEAQAGAASALDHAVRVTVSGVDPAESLVVAWADEQQAPTGERPSPLSTRTLFRVENAWGTNSSRIMAGVVPSWLSDAHVVLFSADGMADPSGKLVHAVEVPTFADPAGSGGRLYLVVTDPRVPVNQGPVRGIAFVAPDGTFLDADGDCARAPELCAGVQPDGLDLRSELLSALTR